MQRAPGRGRGPARRREDVLAVLSDVAQRCAAEPDYRDWALLRLDRVIDLTERADIRSALVSYRRAIEQHCAVVP